ncbi:protein of unknown function [Rhodovastum atsumiense]|nr:protein of unknown function [Rhodovastum atsumiense]
MAVQGFDDDAAVERLGAFTVGSRDFNHLVHRGALQKGMVGFKSTDWI